MRRLKTSLGFPSEAPRPKRTGTTVNFLDPLLQELTEDHRAKLGQAFDNFDDLGDGRILIRKLGVLLGMVGYPLEDPDIELHLRALDLFDSEDRCVSRLGFIRLVAHRQKELSMVGVDFNCDPTEFGGSTRASSIALEPDSSEKEPPQVGCCAYVLFHTIMFVTFWFGTAHFDLDGDGDFDPTDVQLFLENPSAYYSKSFASGRARKGYDSERPQDPSKGKGEEKQGFVPEASVFGASPLLLKKELLKKAKSMYNGMSLENLQGDWIVGEPGQDFTVTIMPDGQCLYDGVHMGDDNDLLEEGMGSGRQIARRDGWFLNLRRSSVRVLTWTDGEQSLEWRRIVPVEELNLVSLVGDWCVVGEDGQTLIEDIEVREQGFVFRDEVHAPELDLRVTYPASAQAHPEIYRANGWMLDAPRSNVEVLVWALQGEQQVFAMWRRPEVASVESVLAQIQSMDAVDVFNHGADMFEDLLDNSVDGTEFESLEKQAVEDMFTKRFFRPKYVVVQAMVAIGFWAFFAVKDHFAIGSDWIAAKAGLDSVFPHSTDLRLNLDDCTSLRFQAWRWLSYQYTHIGLGHVGMNSLLLVLLGIPIEALCGMFKMFLMFNVGVFGGAMAYGVMDGRNLVVGMSGGCYALFGIHVAQIALNWTKQKYRMPKLLVIIFLLVVENVNHHVAGQGGSSGTTASNAAHIGGGVAGLLIGLQFAYNHGEMSRCDIFLRSTTFVVGFALTMICLVMIFSHTEAYPMSEWFSERTYMYTHAQVFNKRCLGLTWRCVRCACYDELCRARLTAMPVYGSDDTTAGGWWRVASSEQQCPKPWYGYNEGLQEDNLTAGFAASMEFNLIPLYNDTHLCSVNLR